VLLINVLPVAYIINDYRPALRFKKDAVISGPQPVFVFETLEFLDIRRQVVLKLGDFIEPEDGAFMTFRVLLPQTIKTVSV
jgi:hypothetical protein